MVYQGSYGLWKEPYTEIWDVDEKVTEPQSMEGEEFFTQYQGGASPARRQNSKSPAVTSSIIFSISP